MDALMSLEVLKGSSLPRLSQWFCQHWLLCSLITDMLPRCDAGVETRPLLQVPQEAPVWHISPVCHQLHHRPFYMGRVARLCSSAPHKPASSMSHLLVLSVYFHTAIVFSLFCYKPKGKAFATPKVTGSCSREVRPHSRTRESGGLRTRSRAGRRLAQSTNPP